ncbi:MAG: hypothetical protein E6K27_13610 [Gammaproteobacteria bacterium]|nr:MAG: hypothetical protein E6K27_13610 [Gammaproteobacteria bacterium]
MQVVAAQRAVAHRVHAARIAIVHQHAEPVPEHRHRHAQLDAIAMARQLPGAVDARLDGGVLLAILAGLDAARRDRPGSGRGEEHLVLLAAAVLESEPHAVTEGRRVERIGARGIEQRVLVAHLEQHVQHPLVNAGEDAEAMQIVLAEVRPRGGVVRPVIGIAVEERRGRERERLQVVGSGIEERTDGVCAGRDGHRGCFGCVRRRERFAVQEVGAPLERGGDGL